MLQFDDAADASIEQTVAAILHDVKARGDAAVLEYTERFDRLQAPSLASLELSGAQLQAALDALPADTRQALEAAADRVRRYHERQVQGSWTYTEDDGTVLGQKVTPLDRVGLYVPGGKAAYPSSVLMNAIPAKVAGVAELIMVVPTPGGEHNQLVLAAAAIAGVDRVFTIGGAQAVAALAYGTQTVPQVDKIVGPGNAYVAAAKRRVFGTVGIDMIAGPSEILVVAEGNNDPAWIAADLLSQAEHDAAAQSILVTDDRAFAQQVRSAVESQLLALPRAAMARASWERHGAIILVGDFASAVPLIDKIAAEHVELAVDDPDVLAARINNASALFSSGLGVLDFMKRTSLLACDAASLRAIGPAAVTLAQAEGLDAHARSI